MPSNVSDRPVIGITIGDAAGIGPEIVLKALLHQDLRAAGRFVIIGDARFLGKLRVVLLSTHLPLLKAIDLIRKDALADLIKCADRELGKLLGRKVTIAVAGLNPHASEGGMFGSEEAEEIKPAIEYCRSLGIE